MFQDVDLTNVVKDPFILDEENPVAVMVKKLHSTNNESEIISYIKDLQALCEKGIEYKLLCGKEQVFGVLVDKLFLDISTDLNQNILQFFSVFLDGNVFYFELLVSYSHLLISFIESVIITIQKY